MHVSPVCLPAFPSFNEISHLSHIEQHIILGKRIIDLKKNEYDENKI